MGTSYIPPVKPILLVHDYEGDEWGRSIFNALFVELVLVIPQHASQSPH